MNEVIELFGSPTTPSPTSQTVDLRDARAMRDAVAWAMGFASSVLLGETTGSPMQTLDYVFQVAQLVPLVTTSAFTLGSKKYSGEDQCGNDVFMAALQLVLVSVYAGVNPESYRDAPKAPGLVLAANLLGVTATLSELMLLIGDPKEWIVPQSIAKFALYTVSAILSFTGSILAAENT